MCNGIRRKYALLKYFVQIYYRATVKGKKKKKKKINGLQAVRGKDEKTNWERDKEYLMDHVK
jgi:hypothetical protein